MMCKRIWSAALIVLTECLLFLTASAAQIPSIQIENRISQSDTLSFDVRLSGAEFDGMTAVIQYGESGQMKAVLCYPAEALISVSISPVSDTDSFKVIWLDSDLCPVTSAITLRMSGNGVNSYIQFTKDLFQAIEELGGTAGAETGSDSPYALKRVIVGCDILPDVSNCHVIRTVSGPGIYVLFFDTPEDAETCAEYLRAQPSVRYAEPDVIVRGETEGTGAEAGEGEEGGGRAE